MKIYFLYIPALILLISLAQAATIDPRLYLADSSDECWYHNKTLTWNNTYYQHYPSDITGMDSFNNGYDYMIAYQDGYVELYHEGTSPKDLSGPFRTFNSGIGDI